jgi:hypothetical protein
VDVEWTVSLTPDVRAVLLKVRDEILTDESKWAQGDDVRLTSTPTCLGMAIIQAATDSRCESPAVLDTAARQALGLSSWVSVQAWNDAPERIYADVRAVLDRVLADEVTAS